MLSDAEKDMIINDFGPGQVDVHICSICGKISWAATHKGKSNSVVVLSTDDLFDWMRCQTCSMMRELHPQVYRWVVYVITYQKKLIELEFLKEIEASAKREKSALENFEETLDEFKKIFASVGIK